VSVKSKPRKTEACEFCGGKHYSEKARERCFVASQRETCECDDYWASRWHSHMPKCPLHGELRDELRKVEPKKPTDAAKPVRRKA